MPDLQDTAGTFKLFGDPSRVRLLRLLAEEELTVAELTRATQLVQSRVSTHLAKLREAGLVRSRQAGAATWYSLADSPDADSAPLLELVRGVSDSVLEEDLERLRALAADRESSWADQVAGQMERHYSPGRTWESAARGLLGLATLGDVLDIASGDGALAELVARRAKSVTCLDRSRRVIRGGSRRTEKLPRLRFVAGDMHALPFVGASFDHLLLMNSLDYAERPPRVLAEAARVLRPGGELAASVLRRHAHEEVADRYDHAQRGFEPTALRRQLRRAGFEVDACEVSLRERRPPHFEIVTIHARRTDAS